MSNDKISNSLRKIFKAIRELNNEYPHKEFTIDGRLVGDIGEILAENNYKIKLFRKLEKDYDAISFDGKNIQIKATFKDSLTFKKVPDYYLGIKINEDGTFMEIYNGPGKYIYNSYAHRKGIGKVLLSFPNRKLLEISQKISSDERIERLSYNINSRGLQ